jgi:hypothetical protein
MSVAIIQSNNDARTAKQNENLFYLLKILRLLCEPLEKLFSPGPMGRSAVIKEVSLVRVVD